MIDTKKIRRTIGMNLLKRNKNLAALSTNIYRKAMHLREIAKLYLNNTDGGRISTVNLELSVLCNLRCQMCWWWGENGIGFKLAQNKDPMVTKQLTKEEVFKIVDELAATHRPSFYISGGEPFIREDTLEIIEYIASKGCLVSLTDNGTLLNDSQLKSLADIKNLGITFSIDGPKEIHDRIRGKGMYERTTNNIKKLLEYRGDKLFPSVWTNITLSPLLTGRIDQLIRELQDNIGVDVVQLQHLWFTDKAHAEAHKKVLHEVLGTNEGAGVDSHIISWPSMDYVKSLAYEIIKVEHTRYSKSVYLHPRMSREEIIKYYTDLNYVHTDRCIVAWNNIFIRANGDVMFCPDEWMTDFKLGNIREHSINELWNNDKAELFRRELWKHKLYPACARCCYIND